MIEHEISIVSMASIFFLVCILLVLVAAFRPKLSSSNKNFSVIEKTAMLAILDSQKNFVYISDSLGIYLNCDQNKVIGANLKQIDQFCLNKITSDKLIRALARSPKSPVQIELDMLNTENAEQKVTVTAHTIKSKGEAQYILYFTDATEAYINNKFQKIALDEGPALIVVQSANFKILNITPAFCTLFEMAKEDMIGHDLVEYTNKHTQNQIKNLRDQMQGTMVNLSAPYEYTTASGKSLWLLSERRIVNPDAIGSQPKYVLSYNDVSELEAQKNLTAILLNNSATIVLSQDASWKIQTVSDGWAHKMGYSREDTIGKDLVDFMPADEAVEARINRQSFLSQPNRANFSAQRTMITKHGEALIVELRSVVESHSGHWAIIIMVIDVTDRVMAQRKLQEMVNHDELTGLLSRRGLRAAIAKRPPGQNYELYLLDIDEFKSINDTQGHEIGDVLLQEIGVALLKTTPQNGFVARLGGEEFAILTPSKRKKASDAYAKFLRHTIASLSVPASHRQLNRTACVGAAFLGHDESLSTALTWADHALREAKKMGKNSTVVADDEFRNRLTEDGRLITQRDLIAAIENDEICKFAQPIVNAKTKKIVGFEALIRWIKPDGQIIPPSKFLGKFQAIEQSPDFLHISRQINTKFIRELEQHPNAYISFNAKLEQLSFKGGAKALMNRFGLELLTKAGRTLVIEIHENSIDERNDRKLVMSELQILRQCGVKIALDDFGQEASNLYRLTNFPVDIVKIDRALIEKIVEEQRSREALRMIVELGERLNFDLTAEGIETEAQKDVLLDLGIQIHQGYFYARPMPTADVNKFELA